MEVSHVEFECNECGSKGTTFHCKNCGSTDQQQFIHGQTHLQLQSNKLE